MDVLHHHLEAVEAACLRDLDLSCEALSKVLEYDTVASRKKGQHMLDEMLFVLFEGLPVLDVHAKIDLVDRPEAGHLVLVHLPDVVVLDWKKDEAVGIVLKKRLGQRLLSLSAVDDAKLRGGKNILRGLNLAVFAAVASVVLVEELGAGALGSVLLGLRELCRHSQTWVLLVREDL